MKRSNAALGRRSGEAERNEHFAIAQHVPARGGAEVFHGDGSPTAGAGDLALGAEGDERGDRVRGGGAVAQVAAKAGPRLDLDATDQGGGIDERGEALLNFGVAVNAGAGRGGANLEGTIAGK
ncbi:MAG TPA: hypothetical protein PKD27_10220 [Tepidiformaceae bacterium]|nr:hypothetical protein [Tepidiformaceae bacterium]